jgi:hypothetical protein
MGKQKKGGYYEESKSWGQYTGSVSKDVKS